MTDINPERFLDDLGAFSKIGGRADGGLDRLAWSPADLEGRRWLAARMRDAGLDVRTDTALNVFGHAPDSTGPRLLLGSHADSVPRGGRLDGAYGVIAALEVVRTLLESNDPLAGRVEAVAFADEEGVRFGEGLLGSEALAGELEVERLRHVIDWQGVQAVDVLHRAGVDLDQMADASRHLPEISAYLELHIEQGPLLDTQSQDLGVVTGIVGVLRQHVEIEGEQNHAGTTPFRFRHDAGRAAARVVTAMRDLVQGVDPEAVANVGVMRFEPGGINVVPGRAEFDVEIRHLDAPTVERIVAALNEQVQAICTEEGCRAHTALRSWAPPAPMDPALMSALERACRSTGRPFSRLPSGAGHDAQVMARHVPAAMLFVPSRRGISHSPLESTSDEHLVLGVRTLLEGVREALG